VIRRSRDAPALSLEPILRCPTCGKSYHAVYVQRGITFPECQKCERSGGRCCCGGLVLPQLTYEFEDETIARSLVETYRMPVELPERRFWQLPLRSKDAYTHRDSSPVILFQALLLLPKSAVMT
jgi:hypothetical protein